MNVWNFTGNIGNDAIQRFTPKGDSIVSFSVAVKSGYGDKAATTWTRCAMFGKRGESVLPYLKKGQLVGVSGEASLREWEKDGSKHSSLEVRISDNGGLTLLGKAEPRSTNSERPEQEPGANKGTQGGVADFEDDIPFLFNMNTLRDTMGQPLSLWRAKHGKVLSVVQANQTDF